MKILLVLLFITSCQKIDPALDYLAHRWLSIDKVTYKHQSLPEGLQIHRPANTWQHAFTVSLLTNLGIEEDCVFYFVPSSKTNGVLKVITKLPGKSCKESFYQNAYVDISKIHFLSFKLDESKIRLNINKTNYDFSFYNKNLDQVNMVSLSHGKYEKKLKDTDICYQTDKSCKVTKSECNKCPNGFFEIIDSKCPAGGTRYCGKETCGEKGGFACPRGQKYIKYTQDYCVVDSPLGFCNEGNSVRCDKGQLICE